MYILHDQRNFFADSIETGSVFPVGQFVPFNYSDVTDVTVPSSKLDLVTCMMGLHHFQPFQLPVLFDMVLRLLRPGGMFVIREHDARPDLMPILDLAHSVKSMFFPILFRINVVI